MEIKNTVTVSIVGKPNTGKSTLLNYLVGSKVAITSPKPQTTRARITGIAESNNTQFVFLDTPGLHKPKSKLGECMTRTVRESAEAVDCIVMVVEPSVTPKNAEIQLVEMIKSIDVPAILAINKIDTIRKDKLLEIIAAYSSLHDFAAVVPISAKTGDGTDILLDEISKFAIEGDRLYPEGMVTDQPEKKMVSELIREKMLLELKDEIPHGIAVDIESIDKSYDKIIKINATIYCEKDSHKSIIIGKNGSMLKRIGERARMELEQFYGAKVFLQTWVKIKENWRDSENFIRNMGLDEI